MAKRKDEIKSSKLKAGDTVMVIAGGNEKKRPNKGKVGKILQVRGNRVVVEGLNKFVRHQRALGPDKPAGKIEREASIHTSNVMYYAEKLKKPVRLRYQVLEDGTKVRGYLDSETKKFVQVD
ncbi:MAG: 50S ribosomal protein L24 [Bdellovibrionales bacterium]|nr:50S ribosomal protein L24 [Bdellovibrionales bacterium]